MTLSLTPWAIVQRSHRHAPLRQLMQGVDDAAHALARRMKANGETAATICETLGIGRTTLYRYLAESDED